MKMNYNSNTQWMTPIASLISLFLCVLLASVCFAETVYWGIEYMQEDVTGSDNDLSNGVPNKLYILKVDLQAKGIRAFVTPDLNGGTLTTSQFVSNYGVQVGINTAFFDINNTNKSIGYFSSDGHPYTSNIKDDSYPTMGFDAQNHCFWGIDNRSKMYNAFSGIYDLVRDGKAVVYENYDVHPRTVAGIDKTGRYFYMIVVDGRYNASTGMTLTAIGRHMERLGVYYGINLDGGGSSTMYFNGEVINNPTTNGKIKEREVSDIVYIGY